MCRFLTILPLFAALLAGCASKAEPEPDNQTMDGTWTFESVQLVGSGDKPNIMTGGAGTREFVFNGDSLKCFGKDFRYQMDPSKTPMTINIAPADGGPAFEGIAQWEGRNLRLSIGAQVQPRPKKFGAEEDITKVDVLLKRQ